MMTNNKTDIFETLKNILGCEYISDMKFEPYRTKAKEALKSMELSILSLSDLKDIAQYLYEKTDFKSKDDILQYLGND